MPRTPRIEALTPHGGANAASRAHIPTPCPVCLKRFRLKQPHQVFCSPRCRVMNFWAGEIISAMERGEAPGLEKRTWKN